MLIVLTNTYNFFIFVFVKVFQSPVYFPYLLYSILLFQLIFYLILCISIIIISFNRFLLNFVVRLEIRWIRSWAWRLYDLCSASPHIILQKFQIKFFYFFFINAFLWTLSLKILVLIVIWLFPCFLSFQILIIKHRWWFLSNIIFILI